jgi:beta-lactamase class A
VKKKLSTLTIPVVLVLASFFAGYTVKARTISSGDNQSTLKASDYPLLAKRLFIDEPNDVIINFSNLREQISTYMSNNSLKGSIYFEYLPTGTSVRHTGDSEYVAASLMKIPVVMELYKASELKRVDLDKTIELKKEWLDPAFGDLYKKGVGYKLTLREAAQIALEHSDNTAISAILNSTENILKPSENVLTSLDVSINRDNKSQIEISARSYASFLKCLYFSCYTTYEDSQEILTYLTNSEFTNRLREGVPNTVKIAHKIGTYSNITQSDCGVVYEPRRNYVLCVILQVPDTDEGNAHIATVSKMVYDYIKNSETKNQ